MKNFDRQLVASYARCKQCGTVVQSLHRHDYKTCSCDNKTMIDGGTDYQRFGGVDIQWVEVFGVYTDEPFEKVRQHMYRLGYGKDTKGPFRIVRLFEMTNEHLLAMEIYPCVEWQMKLIRKEGAYRKVNNISVED